MQSHARALDGPGALLTTRWASYRRGFDSRWQPRVVHASKHTCGCPARNPPRSSALSLKSVETSVLFEPLHDPVHKSRAIFVFSRIRDMYREVPDEAAWIGFIDSVRSLISLSAQDSLLQS